MATASSPAIVQKGEANTLSLIRLTVTGAVTAAVVFILCWVGTFVPLSSPTHAYLTLFTNADMSSGQALLEGSCWSLLFGGLVGALFALVYNATKPLAGN